MTDLQSCARRFPAAAERDEGTITATGGLTLPNALTVTSSITVNSLVNGLDAISISTWTLGSTNGVKIGATGDKAAFLGATPIVRQTGGAAKAGGTYTATE